MEGKSQTDRLDGDCYSWQDILLSLTKQCIGISEILFRIKSTTHTDNMIQRVLKKTVKFPTLNTKGRNAFVHKYLDLSVKLEQFEMPFQIVK